MLLPRRHSPLPRFEPGQVPERPAKRRYPLPHLAEQIALREGVERQPEQEKDASGSQAQG